jgi:hypothetical protein
VRSAAYCSSRMKFDTGSMVTKQIPGGKGFVFAHRHRRSRHPLGKRRALLRDHGRFHVNIERVLRAVAYPDEGRQSAQLQEFTHQPPAARRPQGDAEMRRQHHPMQPSDPLRGAHEVRQARRWISARNLPAPPPQGAARHPRSGRHAASRVSAATTCSACYKRVRRLTPRSPGRILLNLRVAPRPRLV